MTKFSNSFDKLKEIDTTGLKEGIPYTPPPTKASPISQHKGTLPEGRSKTIIQITAAKNRKTRMEYDEWLSKEPTEDHNPNPFDFVFLSNHPALYSDEEIKHFEQTQDLFSGHLEIELTALTPVHIVGTQVPSSPGHSIERSNFYKESSDYCIPGSSIQGMLRGFIEALTNGWISQAQEKEDPDPAYSKSDGQTNPQGRHIGFDSFKVTENTHSNGKKSFIGPGILPVYRPDRTMGIDISSYLFGIISKEKGLSRKHKVEIEDAFFQKEALKDFPMVDINNTAFMGGAHPSASNWWYMIPKVILERRTGNGHHVMELVGEGFWGRKFYFHQNPVECINFYTNSQQWPSNLKRPIYEYNAACLKEKNKVCFNIYVKRLPKAMLDLLCLCLMPGENIRHKLGYGKQYGYGSVDFKIKKALMRKEKKDSPFDLLKEEEWEFKAYNPCRWEARKDLKIAEKSIIDESSLKNLARILNWQPTESILFSYPPNSKKYFQTPIRYPEDFKPLRLDGLIGNNLSEKNAIDVARQLWSTKKTIHFHLYQARAKRYKEIVMKREP